MNDEANPLRAILRVIGTLGLLAIPCVVLPHGWMDSVHRWLGMGPLADQPIVGYLARSTSAFYAITGGLMWITSFDLPRYRQVLQYLGATTAIFGVLLVAVDWLEGMPLFWILVEGPVSIVMGVSILILANRVRHGKNTDRFPRE